MEVFMTKVSWSSTRADVVSVLAQHLHRPPFMGSGTTPFNFHVHLINDRHRRRRHGGCGCITFPTVELGEQFLSIYGESGILLNGMMLQFSLSKHPRGRPEIVERIKRNPYVNPRELAEASRLSGLPEEVAAHLVEIETIQFGWDCRDQVVSIESEISPPGCSIGFDEERRQFRIQFFQGRHKYIVATHFSQIDTLTAHHYLQAEAVVLFYLTDPPTYEMEENSPAARFNGGSTPASTDLGLEAILEQFAAMFLSGYTSATPLRKQLSFLPIPDHERVAPYASLVLRLVLKNPRELSKFRELSKRSGYHHIGSSEYQIEHRHIFSEEAVRGYEKQVEKLPWPVAFQVVAIVRKRSMDIQEMLALLPSIVSLVERIGENDTALLLRDFSSKVFSLYRSDEPEDSAEDAVQKCFDKVVEDFDRRTPSHNAQPTDDSLFEALHLTITPTTMILDGPHPERSNRVIRTYGLEHQDSFLRVTFAEEGRLQYRFDREIDSREFIRSRVGNVLFNGLDIAGQSFQFLAYSMSALKEHTVWFSKPFRFGVSDSETKMVEAADIIKNLGRFDGLEFDPKLTECPARYAARISQAFTATESSVSIGVEEIIHAKDIEKVVDGQKQCFTDGVGVISKAVARDIGRTLKLRVCPHIFQIRVMGSKGMVSVDHRLQGRVLLLRPSMTKFDAPNALDIEIASAFVKPTLYYLNRPLIMLMEGLGIPYDTIERLQVRAVRETERAVLALSRAGKLLETHGLGSSFRLPSVMNSLSNLGIPTLLGDRFYDKSLEFAKNHVLRQLKHRARIPVPGAWTLVGVADIHSHLQEGEIFACVKPINEKAIYLEGPVLISRSPVIHPGDVQIANAIGRPPPGSCFEREPLANSVVFSVLGDRPLASCLGGGDLDGDVYNLIPLNNPDLSDFTPAKTFEPSKYTAVEKKLIGRKSTMKDVAEFVMEYISSDVVGIIATNWLIIADQSDLGIEDPDCLTLADLHSHAVDYQKSGNPVNPNTIPKLKRREKPDWNAPETVDPEASQGKYYKSERFIGKLFRAIDLPAESRPMEGATRISARDRRPGRMDRNNTDDEFSYFATDPTYTKLERHVHSFGIGNDEPLQEELQDAENLFLRYSTELQGICITNTLSSARHAALTEEEAFIGTIVQKTSQRRRREEMTSRLRESTDILVRGIREVLEGDEEDDLEVFLRRSWLAWQIALDKGREFGAQSFGWVSLGGVFEAIRKIKERDMDM